MLVLVGLLTAVSRLKTLLKYEQDIFECAESRAYSKPRQRTLLFQVLKVGYIVLLTFFIVLALFLRYAPTEFQHRPAWHPIVVVTVPSAILRNQVPHLCGRPRFSQQHLPCAGVCGKRITVHAAFSQEPNAALLYSMTTADEVHVFPANRQHSLKECGYYDIDFLFYTD